MIRWQVTVLLGVAILTACMNPALANPASRFAAAQDQLRNGRYADALGTFSALQDEYPKNVDYIFGAGQALARLNRNREALARFATAIELAPDYEAVWREQHAVLLRLNRPEELKAFRLRAAERFPAASWWQASSQLPVHSWTVLLGAGVDSLSNDLPGWNNQFAELQYVRRQSQRYLIRLARDARSRRSDVSTAVGAAFSGESWFGGGDLSLAPGASFQPRNAYSLHAGRSFADGWVGTVSGYRRAYETATVSGTALIIERYFGDYRIAYKVGRSRLHGATGFSSHTLTGNWYYTEASNVGISLGGGDEAESIGDGRILVTAVRNVALTGRHRVNPRVSLHWWLGTHKQGDLYRRRYLGVAVSIGI